MSIAIHLVVYFLIRSDDELLFSGIVFFVSFLFFCYGIYWFILTRKKLINRFFKFLFGLGFLLIFSILGGGFFLYLGLLIPDFSHERSVFSLMYRHSYTFVYFLAVLFPSPIFFWLFPKVPENIGVRS
jgi:hypothetical protein